MGKVVTGFGQDGKIGEALHCGDAWEFLAKVVGIAAEVAGG